MIILFLCVLAAPPFDVRELGRKYQKQVESEDGSLVFQLYVAENDVGKVIGRQGRIARALRTIVRAGGPHAGRRLQLEIVG